MHRRPLNIPCNIVRNHCRSFCKRVIRLFGVETQRHLSVSELRPPPEISMSALNSGDLLPQYSAHFELSLVSLIMPLTRLPTIVHAY